MNIRDFEYIVAVADNLHFGNAALACHVSQPTLSMQIKKLEEYLGVTIFERRNRQVIITPGGEAIISRARQVLRAKEEIVEVAKAARDPLAGDLRLGLFPTLAPYLLPHCITPLHQALPKMNLLLVEDKTARLIEQLQKGVIDAALLALPVTEAGLEQKVLFNDPFYLAVPKKHILAKRKSVDFAAIQNESLLLLDEGHCLREQALEVCRISHIAERQEFRATSLETLRHMVSANVGITLIPRIAIQTSNSISYIPFADGDVQRRIGLVWRKETPRQEAITRVCDIIIQVIGASYA